MSLPIGMHRRAFSYDDALEDTAPMTPPPSDMCSNVLWKQPVIPERKYQELSKVEEGETSMYPPVIIPSSSTESVNKVPVVKAKATHIIMNSLITKQTQENIQRFEQQAGLRDAGYTPHKGLTAEETKYHRVAEALHVRHLSRTLLWLSCSLSSGCEYNDCQFWPSQITNFCFLSLCRLLCYLHFCCSPGSSNSGLLHYLPLSFCKHTAVLTTWLLVSLSPPEKKPAGSIPLGSLYFVREQIIGFLNY
uniref:Putative monooxygenase p33MONOX n=1 Tax=Terrapene triunguis TaxID=2587831 RepID=A0A674IY18_9SAUR